MSRSTDLNDAKRAKKDEFYTRREEIEAELINYKEQFKGKSVYCNCDNPEYSEFWKFFKDVFYDWELKSLTATYYNKNGNSYVHRLEPNNAHCVSPLNGNGDFSSPECIELLKEADIVVTNPPFSQWRKYFAQLIEYKKDFIIIGNVNAITYKEFFPLLMENKVWMGASIHSGDRAFYVPDDYPLEADGCGIDEETGRKFIKVKGVRWFTTLDNKQHHEPLDLRGNYYDPEKYPHYDNYYAIEVSKTKNIPCDYDGVMGVPITFIDKYCPEQFEIVGVDVDLAGPVVVNGKEKPHPQRMYVNGKCLYARILIRNKHPEQPNK